MTKITGGLSDFVVLTQIIRVFLGYLKLFMYNWWDKLCFGDFYETQELSL